MTSASSERHPNSQAMSSFRLIRRCPPPLSSDGLDRESLQSATFRETPLYQRNPAPETWGQGAHSSFLFSAISGFFVLCYLLKSEYTFYQFDLYIPYSARSSY